MQPITDAVDFVIVDFQEFDKFKGEHIESGNSYLKMNELLEFFIDQHQQVAESIITQYNHTYLKMSGNDVDKLCRWIYGLRRSFEPEGFRVFSTGNYIVLYNYRVTIAIFVNSQEATERE